MISADEVIIRYIRVRFGDESGKDSDAISARYVKNLILDHVSASWSVDETMSIYHCENITVQWCMITESMFNSSKDTPHGFGGIFGSHHSTYHHNLIRASLQSNPVLCFRMRKYGLSKQRALQLGLSQLLRGRSGPRGI